MSDIVKTSGYDYVRVGDTWHRTLDGALGADVSKYGGEETLCLLDALAAAERELEGVRKVEAYMKRIRNRVERRDGLWFAEVSHPSSFPQYEPPTWVPDAYAPTLAALGHLLPEPPDA